MAPCPRRLFTHQAGYMGGTSYLAVVANVVSSKINYGSAEHPRYLQRNRHVKCGIVIGQYNPCLYWLACRHRLHPIPGNNQEIKKPHCSLPLPEIFLAL